MAWQPPGGEASPPHAPPPPPPPVAVVGDGRRWKTWQAIVAAAVALVVGIAIGAATNSEKKTNTVIASPTSTSTSSTVAVTPPTQPPTTTVTQQPSGDYKVGDTANTSGLQAKVYGFRDPQPPVDSFNTPKTGNHFVSVDVQITNPGSSQQRFSSLLGFHLLDSQNRQYDEDLTSGGLIPGAPDGELAAGQSIRGFVVFETPDGTTGLRFRVQGSITAAGAVFRLT